MVLRMLGAALALAVAGPTAAQGDVYLCVDAEGLKTYTNTPTSRACKRLENQPVLSVPAPKSVPTPSRGSSGAQPANFPRVDAETQRTRDADRRRILEDELRSEREKLARLQAEFNNGEPERRGDERNYARYQERVAKLQDDIQRSEASINSLNRELAALRQ